MGKYNLYIRSTGLQLSLSLDAFGRQAFDRFRKIVLLWWHRYLWPWPKFSVCTFLPHWVQVRDSLMIGDGWGEWCGRSQRVELCTVFYNVTGRRASLQPTYHISNLKEWCRFCDGWNFSCTLSAETYIISYGAQSHLSRYSVLPPSTLIKPSRHYMPVFLIHRRMEWRTVDSSTVVIAATLVAFNYGLTRLQGPVPL